jgi:hypothetical protein
MRTKHGGFEIESEILTAERIYRMKQRRNGVMMRDVEKRLYRASDLHRSRTV